MGGLSEASRLRMTERSQYEVIVIGAGIAGASFAHFLSERGVTDVLVVERESVAGYHATGRSAAMAFEFDPDATVQRLKVAGVQFLREPGEGFSHHPLLEPRGVLLVYKEPLWSGIQNVAEHTWKTQGLAIDLLSAAQACERVEVLKADEFDGALLLREAARIDVHELLSSYLRGARSRGVEIRHGVEVSGVLVERGVCAGIATSAGEIRAPRVVNAAGAWAGEVAGLAGATPIEVTARRRCAVVYDAPDGVEVGRWPLVGSEHHRVYFEPESGGLLMSPMDEAPTPPCDAHPDERTIAAGLERLRALAPAIFPLSLRRTWAGLRTFSPDGAPIVGEDPMVRGFFWLAAQGGTGIVTSGALGPLAVDLLVAGKTERFDASLLDPARFR
jgi:D-arginine dehydrogenase